MLGCWGAGAPGCRGVGVSGCDGARLGGGGGGGHRGYMRVSGGGTSVLNDGIT